MINLLLKDPQETEQISTEKSDLILYFICFRIEKKQVVVH